MEKISREQYETNLSEILMIAEATFIWSKKYLDIIYKYSDSFSEQIDVKLFQFGVSLRKGCKLAQHYNQLYFNDCLIHLNSILGEDKSIISLRNYGKKFKLHTKEFTKELNKLQIRMKEYNFKHFRDNYIAHKNERQIESIIDNVRLTINIAHYDKLSILLTEIAIFMAKFFKEEIDFLISFEKSFMRSNKYELDLENSIDEILKLVEKEILKYYNQFCKEHKPKLKGLFD